MQQSHRRPLVLTLTALSIVASSWLVAARAGDEEAPQQHCAPDPRAEARKLEAEIGSLFQEKKYAEAAEKCRAQMALVPDDCNPVYNLACALARQDKKDEALAALAKSVELGWFGAAHMKKDPDLASLRDDKAFADLVAKSLENDKRLAAGTDDVGLASVPGAKVVDRSPEGGVRYRLLLPEDAKTQKTRRLIVWMHPAGESMNKTIEAYAPQWLAAGYAVLVPTRLDWRGWSEGDATKLLEKSLPDAAKVPGVDAARPVLLGFSAGGQMALHLWNADPSRFGGVVLDAAYPVQVKASEKAGEDEDDEGDEADEKIAVLPVPAGDAAKKVPVYVLVGEADPGHKVWKMAEDGWKKAGVPLVVHYVPEGKHEWLLRAELLNDFAKWLEDVGAGRLPGATEAAAKPAAPETPAK